MHDDEADVSSGATNGYEQIIPVDRDVLRNLGVSNESCKTFASRQNVAHLNIIEFFHALPYFPIAFIKQKNNSYTPCAVLGLNVGQNLFIDVDGNWQDGIYNPAYIRRYPFITEAVTQDELKLNDESLRKPVFVDKNALVKDAAALFIANGVATSEWDNINSFVSDYISAEKLTLCFTQKVNELGLFEPFDAQVYPKGSEMVRLKGLYRINEDKLNKLPAKVIKGLMQSGELSRIYAHLISLENFAKLLDRSAKQKI